jgi:hypothetical protein
MTGWTTSSPVYGCSRGRGALWGGALPADNEGMEPFSTLGVDAVHGIQYRAVPRRDPEGWGVQWRPLRAIRTFPTFSYISRAESFPTEHDAMEFIRRNAGAIVTREI